MIPIQHGSVATQHGTCRSADALLNLIQRWTQRTARGWHQLHVDLEEGFGRIQDAARAPLGCHSLLEGIERVLGRVEQGLVDEMIVVILELDNVAVKDLFVRRFELVRRDLFDQIIDGMLDLGILLLQHRRLDANVLPLHVDKVRHGKGGIVGQVHQQTLAHHLEILLDAILHHIVDVANELVKSAKATLNVRDEGVNVHRRPRQRDHARPELVFHVGKVRTENDRRCGDHSGGDAIILRQCPLQLTGKCLEALFLVQNNLGILWNVQAHTFQTLGLANELEDVLIEIDVQLIVVGMANHQRRLKASLGLIDGLDPGLVPKKLECHQSPSDLVVHLDDASSVLGRQECSGGIVGLKLLHGLLDPLQEMTTPGNVASDGG